MSSSTVRVDKDSRSIIQEIREEEGLSAQEILHRALENYRRKLFLKKLGEAYGAAKGDKKTWGNETSEREEWDNTTGDSMEKDK